MATETTTPKPRKTRSKSRFMLLRETTPEVAEKRTFELEAETTSMPSAIEEVKSAGTYRVASVRWEREAKPSNQMEFSKVKA